MGRPRLVPVKVAQLYFLGELVSLPLGNSHLGSCPEAPFDINRTLLLLETWRLHDLPLTLFPLTWLRLTFKVHLLWTACSWVSHTPRPQSNLCFIIVVFSLSTFNIGLLD